MSFDWTQRITLGVAIVAGSYFIAHTLHKQRQPSTSVSQAREIELRTRISALIGEGVGLQQKCQAVPDPYQAPVQSVPALANAIVEWKGTVQTVLSMDLDPTSLEKWQKAILYASPEAIKADLPPEN